MARIDSGGEETGMGKVRVIVRISSKRPLDEERTRYFNVDKKKRQVTMLDPTVGRGEIPIEERKVGVAAPKMFAYDGIFGCEDSQEEVSTACLTDVISSVINGNDGCLFCFGHSNLGKTYTMVGDDAAKSSVGVIPTAIAWMYKVIKDRKQKTSARFSVRVSAVEISQEENLSDLLTNYASETDQSPGVYLRQLPASQSCVLQNLSEVRASSVDKAAYYLDAALSSRTTDAQGRQSHFLYTIHVYQYSVEKSGKGGVAGGRSRLHLIDFGGCDRTQGPGSGITLSGLGNVILGIFNGQKHLPCRNSKVTGILKECLGSLTCNATMVAHVSPEPSHYSETLHTLQLASRIHRMRRKRMKNSSSRGGGSNSSDEGRRMGRGSSKSGSSDFTTSTDPSSSEMSCNTVVYRGHSDGSGTDGEHPPNLGLQRFKRRNLSGSRILTNGTISPRLGGSPQPSSPLSPANSQYLISSSPARLTPTLPSIRESNTAAGKMPLNGKVPGYRQPAQVWIDGEKERQAGLGVQQQRYGYMDDFKANMISTWVENQKDAASGSLYLTQFKQAADSDEGSERAVVCETKAEVHQPLERRSGPPPPPPPRRSSSREKELHLGGSVVGLQPYALSKSHSRGPTLNLEDVSHEQPLDQVDTVPRLKPREELSPRDDLDLSTQTGPDPCQISPLGDQGLRLSPRGEIEGSDSTDPLPEPNFEQLFPSELLGCGKTPVEQESPIHQPQPQPPQPLHSGHQRPLSDQFGDPALLPDNSHQHPLRILSEENLTVVSTFVADLNDLEDPDDDDDDCSVSKLSFFEVPDLLREEDLQVSDDKYFETRLRELTRMTEAKKQQQQESPPAQSNRFTDPRFKDVDTKEGLSTFSPSSEKAPPAAESSPEVLPEVMTPQKQFLLLNQTLRRPDGSSNPDMDLVTSSCDPASSCNPTISGGGVPVTPNSNLVPLTKRSPGSGQSNSDPEDEPVLSKSSDPLPRQESSKKEPTKKREISNIAFMLLRLFGSSRKKGSTKKGCEKRSKSCDRELDSAAAPPPPPQKSIKSASSSPMKRTDRKAKTDSKLKLSKNPDELSDASRRPLTPSTLSLAATEWEFQAQQHQEEEDEANGNQELLNATYLNNYLDDPRLTGTYQYSAVLQRQERKSSGYDSLEGENSSLDSSGGNGNGGSTDISPRGGAGDPWTNVYRTTGSHYRSPVVAADPYRTTAGGTAAEQYSRLYAELDDIAMLKLEINRHPDILNKNY